MKNFEPDQKSLLQHAPDNAKLRSQNKPSPRLFEPPDPAVKILTVVWWLLLIGLVVYVATTATMKYTDTTPADWIEKLKEMRR